MHTSFNDFIGSISETVEHHTENPNDKYEVRPCDEPGTPFAVWEGDLRVKCFKTEEEAQAYADGENEKQGLDEGTMSDIHQLAGEVKDLAEFTKEFFKRFGDKIKKTADSVEWVKTLYSDMANESVVTEASGDLKIGDHGIDYNDNVVEIIAIGRFAKIAKMFKKETKADVEDYGIEELMVNTDYYLTKNIESPEGNVGDYYIYPVRYDMANYWGLDPLKESVVTEARFNYKETGLSGQNLKDVKDGITGIKNALKRGNESAVISNYDLVQQRLQQYGGPKASEFLEKIKQLVGLDESIVTEAKSIKVTKKEWPYVEFKSGSKTHKVEFDYEDIIDDHGNEGQDQYWLGKDDDGKEWSIDVYADYNGNVEEVHYDTIVAESAVTEGKGFKIGDKVEITKFIQDAENDETGDLYDFDPGVKVEITDIDGNHSYQFKYLDKLPGERYWALRKEFKANIIKESSVNEGKGFKNTEDFEAFLEEIDGMGDAQIKKIMGKDYIDTPGFYQDEKDNYEDIIDFMISNMGRKEFEKLNDWWENNVQESVVTEGKKVTLKRRYTENHPAVTAGKHAKIRNKVLEFIKDGKITAEAFETYVAGLSNNSKRWTKNNSKYFTISEEGVSLSKFGQKILKGITVNEKTEKNPEIWVPGGFDKEIGKYPNSKITKEIVLKAAKKWDVAEDDAIAYVEYGWDLDLNENKTNMKTQFIYESFSEFVNSLNESTESLNEAFASTKLASILTGGNKMDKDLPKAFYQMAKIALDKIQDVDIIEMDPATAKKEKRANAIYMYFTTNAKENPYAGKSSWREEREIPANTLLAITNGQNEWMATEWQRSYSRDKNATRVLKTTKRDSSAGIGKSGARSEYGSGISSMKQVAELADRAYCLDLDILRARYSTTAQRDERAAAKKGAIAFQNDKEFKAENLSRYNNIIANRAAKMPIDKMVADSIDIISKQIKDGLAKGEKGRYGEIVVGKNSKGRECKLADAARHMQHILDEFQRYVNDTNQAEIEKKAGYDGSYYANRVKQSAKEITDKIKQIESFGYAW